MTRQRPILLYSVHESVYTGQKKDNKKRGAHVLELNYWMRLAFEESFKAPSAALGAQRENDR